MKKVFVIDWVLVPLFAVSGFTDFGLHIAGHGDSHALWHNWAVAHIVSSLLFTVFVLWHVKMHWGWYKGLFRTGPGRRRKSPGCERSGPGITGRARSRRSRVTVAVSVLFAAVALTGYVLLAVSGAGSGIGLWHYRIGVVAAVLFCGHILKRTPVLRKSLSGSGRQASGEVRRTGWRVRRTMSVH